MSAETRADVVRFGRHPPYDGSGEAPALGILSRTLGVEGMRAAAGAVLLLGVVIIASGRDEIGIAILVLGGVLFFMPSAMSLRGSWVEIDRARGLVREHRPNHWSQPQEQPLSDFDRVEIGHSSGDGGDLYDLALLRPDSRFGLSVANAGDAAALIPVARRLAEATGLPFGEHAQALMQGRQA